MGRRRRRPADSRAGGCGLVTDVGVWARGSSDGVRADGGRRGGRRRSCSRCVPSGSTVCPAMGRRRRRPVDSRANASSEQVVGGLRASASGEATSRGLRAIGSSEATSDGPRPRLQCRRLRPKLIRSPSQDATEPDC